MIIAFGLAWPATVIKSVKSRTAKGKSLAFMIGIWLGYLFGVLAHIFSNEINYPMFFYFINMGMVTADICLYFRNRRLDREADAAAAANQNNPNPTPPT